VKVEGGKYKREREWWKLHIYSEVCGRKTTFLNNDNNVEDTPEVGDGDKIKDAK
jgi:hypothetical protein